MMDKSKNPILFDPRCRIVFRFGLSGKTYYWASFWQRFFSISQEINNSSWVNCLYKVGISYPHFEPKIKTNYKLCHRFKITFKHLVNGLKLISFPDHHWAIIAIFVVFLTSKISSPQCSKLTIIGKEFV